MLKLTAEQSAALRNAPGGEPLQLLDEQTQRVYLLVDPQSAREIAVTALRQELAGALAEADRGDAAPWDVEAIIQEQMAKRGGDYHQP